MRVRGVLIHGPVALAVADALHRAAVAGVLDGMPVKLRELLPDVHRDLDDEARAWLGQVPARGTAAPVALADVPASNPAGSWRVQTSEAARILGITERAVRKRAASLGGELIHGMWQFPREAILAEAKRKAG